MKTKYWLTAAFTACALLCGCKDRPKNQPYTAIAKTPDALVPQATPKSFSLAKTMGAFGVVINGRFVSHGSSVLVDNQGYVALSAHQILNINANNMQVGFDGGDGNLIFSSVQVVYSNPKTDIAFARLTDPNFIAQNGLQPVNGFSGHDTFKKPAVLFAYTHDRATKVGPELFHLHQVNAITASYLPTYQALNESGTKMLTFSCMMEATTDAPGAPGMSGGPLFDDALNLISVLNGGVVGKGFIFFPAGDAVQAAYNVATLHNNTAALTPRFPTTLSMTFAPPIRPLPFECEP